MADVSLAVLLDRKGHSVEWQVQLAPVRTGYSGYQLSEHRVISLAIRRFLTVMPPESRGSDRPLAVGSSSACGWQKMQV
jgi:hypothetical protein